MVKKEVQSRIANLEDNISVLNQHIKKLEESKEKLKRAYEKKNPENFDTIKKEIIKIQGDILMIINPQNTK